MSDPCSTRGARGSVPSSLRQRFQRWRRQRLTAQLVRTLDPLDGRPEDNASAATDEAVVRQVQRLLQAGADPNGRLRFSYGDDGWEERPALLLALCRPWAMDDAWDHQDVPGVGWRTVQALLNAGADPDVPRTHHETGREGPEAFVVGTGVATHGAVMGTTGQGMSESWAARSARRLTLSLHQAVIDDLPAVVALLLRAGATAARLDHGLTVWDLVHSVATADALRDAGLDPFMANAAGHTRLDRERTRNVVSRPLLAWFERQALQRAMAQDAGACVPGAPRARSRL